MYAQNAYWTNTEVKIQASSLYTNDQARTFTAGKVFTIFAILAMFTVAAVATVIHVNSCGDKPGAEAEVFVNSM